MTTELPNVTDLFEDAPTDRSKTRLDVRGLPPPQPLQNTLGRPADVDDETLLVQLNRAHTGSRLGTTSMLARSAYVTATPVILMDEDDPRDCATDWNEISDGYTCNVSTIVVSNIYERRTHGH